MVKPDGDCRCKNCLPAHAPENRYEQPAVYISDEVYIGKHEADESPSE